jgi:hypothetical protein
MAMHDRPRRTAFMKANDKIDEIFLLSQDSINDDFVIPPKANKSVESTSTSKTLFDIEVIDVDKDDDNDYDDLEWSRKSVRELQEEIMSLKAENACLKEDKETLQMNMELDAENYRVIEKHRQQMIQELDDVKEELSRAKKEVDDVKKKLVSSAEDRDKSLMKLSKLVCSCYGCDNQIESDDWRCKNGHPMCKPCVVYQSEHTRKCCHEECYECEDDHIPIMSFLKAMGF